MKSTIFATALMMLAYAAGAKAQDKVRITVIPPENGTITVSPQLPPDCMVERGTKLTIRAAANKGYMLDGIYATADQPYKYYNECCAPESLLVADKAMEVGVSFLPQKTFSKIRITNNVAYARPGNKTLKYDVFAPKKAKNLPCVIIVHGGGWSSNTEDIMRGMGRELAMTGKFVVFSIDYRFIRNGDGSDVPVEMYQIIEDVYGAIAHIMEHAALYGGDATRLFVTGDSAGGHLSAAAINFANFIGDGGYGSSYGIYEFKPTYIPQGKTTAQIRNEICQSLLGAVPTYPVLTENALMRFYNSDFEKIRHITPICFIPKVTERRVPQLIIRGTQDGLITDADMQNYCKAMTDAGQEVKYLQVGGIGHAFFDWRHDARSQETFDRYARPQIKIMVDFFEDILSRKK